MTIRKGEEWGTPAARPSGLVVARTDAELAAMVAAEPGGEFGVAGGDLFRSLGSPPSRAEGQRLPIDAVRVRLDGAEPILAVAHVVAHRRWVNGPVVIATNCGYVRGFDAAPRAHPNDGRLDVIEVDPSMSIRQRLQARRRARSGTHLPHPQLRSRTVESMEWEWTSPITVDVDGVARGRCTRLTVEVLPDHFAIHA
jgi:hypothetical protein